jgi:hypothetical protein
MLSEQRALVFRLGRDDRVGDGHEREVFGDLDQRHRSLFALDDHIGGDLCMGCPEAEAECRRSRLGELRDPRAGRDLPVPKAVGEHQLARQDVAAWLLQVRRVDAPDLAALLARAGDEAQSKPPLSNEITKCRRQVRSFGAYPRPDDRR